jgi:hypothetical protein
MYYSELLRFGRNTSIHNSRCRFGTTGVCDDEEKSIREEGKDPW